MIIQNYTKFLVVKRIKFLYLFEWKNPSHITIHFNAIFGLMKNVLPVCFMNSQLKMKILLKKFPRAAKQLMRVNIRIILSFKPKNVAIKGTAGNKYAI